MLNESFFKELFGITNSMKQVVATNMTAEQAIAYLVDTRAIKNDDNDTKDFIRSFVEKKGNDIIREYVEFKVESINGDDLLKQISSLLDFVEGALFKSLKEGINDKRKLLDESNKQYSSIISDIKSYFAEDEFSADTAKDLYTKSLDGLIKNSGDLDVDNIVLDKIESYKAKGLEVLNAQKPQKILTYLKLLLEQNLNSSENVFVFFRNANASINSFKQLVVSSPIESKSEQIYNSLLRISKLFETSEGQDFLATSLGKTVPGIFYRINDLTKQALRDGLSADEFVIKLVETELILNDTTYESEAAKAKELYIKCYELYGNDSDKLNELIDEFNLSGLREVFADSRFDLEGFFNQTIETIAGKITDFELDAGLNIQNISKQIKHVQEKLAQVSTIEIDKAKSICTSVIKELFSTQDAEELLHKCDDVEKELFYAKLIDVYKIAAVGLSSNEMLSDSVDEEFNQLLAMRDDLHNKIKHHFENPAALYKDVEDGLVNLMKLTYDLVTKAKITVDDAKSFICSDGYCQTETVATYSEHEDQESVLVDSVDHSGDDFVAI